jgi:hypothetical protein
MTLLEQEQLDHAIVRPQGDEVILYGVLDRAVIGVGVKVAADNHLLHSDFPDPVLKFCFISASFSSILWIPNATLEI